MGSRHKRIDIQMETLAYIQNRGYMRETKYHRYSGRDEAPILTPITETRIEVVKMDTLDAVILYQESTGKRFCFLVMANAFHPGGGYLRGARAQEESICRRTNLPLCFEVIEYPLDKYGGVYVENIFIFRGKESTGCAYLEKEYQSDAILVAAFSNPPTLMDGSLTPMYRRKTIKKIRMMFDECIRRGMKNLILGALGCGAFYNPPEDIAGIFKELLQGDYKNVFENVIFAIIDGETTDNYNIFRDTLG